MAYRSVKLSNGKSYSADNALADEFERLQKLNMKEEDKDKKDMEHEEEEKKKDMEEAEYLKKDKKKKDMEEEEKKEDMEEEEKKEDEEGEEEKKKDEENKGFEDKDKKGKLEDKLNEALKRLNALEGENKALKAMKKADRNDARQEAVIKERLAVLNEASSLLKVNSEDLINDDVLTIKTKVINELCSDIKTDGQTAEAIDGMYQVVVADKGEAYTKILDKTVKDADANFTAEAEKEKGKLKDEAMKAFEERKNAWKEPLNKIKS